MNTPTNEELEQAYQQANFGTSLAPSVIVVNCGQCNRSYLLTKGHVDVCEHLSVLLKYCDAEVED
jgi:hypothetical protein